MLVERWFIDWPCSFSLMCAHICMPSFVSLVHVFIWSSASSDTQKTCGCCWSVEIISHLRINKIPLSIQTCWKNQSCFILCKIWKWQKGQKLHRWCLLPLSFHRTLESKHISNWRGPIRIIKSNSLPFTGISKTKPWLRVSSRCSLNSWQAWCLITSLRTLFQWLTSLSVKNLFLMSNLNVPWCSFIPFPCVLWLVSRGRRAPVPLLLP